jgi:predicted transcriptional regulator of viral defense system
MNKTNVIIEKIKENGFLRSKDIVSLGISREYIRKLLDKGLIVKVRRGLYSSPEAEISSDHSLAEAAKIIPHGIVCLLSALSFHDLTTQNPWEVWMMIEKKWNPIYQDFPMRIVHCYTSKAFLEGIEEHTIEGVKVKIYSPAKTIVDCFKFRNKIGIDIAIEALKDSLRKRICRIEEIAGYARICRASNVIRPYLEAVS